MQILLPSAHSAVLVEDKPRIHHNLRRTMLTFGLLVVLLGALDIVSRLPLPQLDNGTLRTAFAPAATLP